MLPARSPAAISSARARPTERETLVSRLIDRPIRPLFVDGYKNETQLIATVLSHDLENDPDVVAMIASSAALTLSGIPFMGPIGAARVGVLNGEFVLNPTLEQQKQSDLDLVVAGTRDAVLMVESEARELSEDTMLGAVMFGYKSFQPVLDAIIRLAERAARSPRKLVADDTGDILANVRGSAGEGLRGAYRIAKKEERHLKIDEIKESVLSSLAPEGSEVDPRRSPAPSRMSRRRSCAATSSRPAPGSTAAASPTSVPSCARSVSFPTPMAPRCSPAARPRRWS